MKKYVVISSNENPKYLFYLPLVVWAWRNIGWDSAIFYHGNQSKLTSLIFGTFDMLNAAMPPQMRAQYRLVMIGVDDIEGHKSSTLAQVSRLYAACRFTPVDYLMTSDADMIPLSDYWKIDGGSLYTDRNGNGKYALPPKPTTWGRDLTDYHYPICYVGMLGSDWRKVMKIDRVDHQALMKRDMDTIKSRDGVWSTDQEILTQRILEYGEDKFKHINRGTDHRTGYPIGRVDRSNWHLNHTQWIDAHLPHDVLTNQESYNNVIQLLKKNWPTFDFGWFDAYYKEFKKLC